MKKHARDNNLDITYDIPVEDVYEDNWDSDDSIVEDSDWILI